MSEAWKAAQQRQERWQTQFGYGHFAQYIRLPGIDIGYSGSGDYPPVYDLEGIDLQTPGYNGLYLPYETESLWTVHASHVLEHLVYPHDYIAEWFRVLKVGGHLIITVPHQHLYEKKADLPSRYNADHKRFYTPALLLMEVENSLLDNHYRIVYLRDNDWNFNYDIPPEIHSTGCYEIELIIKKINPPSWEIK